MVAHDANGAETIGLDEAMEQGASSFEQGLDAIAAEYELSEEVLGKIRDLAAVSLAGAEASPEEAIVAVPEAKPAKERKPFTLDDIHSEGQLLLPRDVGDLLRVGPKTVSRWAKTGRLVSVKTLGGHRRFRVADVRRAMAEAGE